MSSVKMVSLLRSFGCDSSGTAVWDGPWGICVSGQFVYVTDLDGYNVSVFEIISLHLVSMVKRLVNLILQSEYVLI